MDSRLVVRHSQLASSPPRGWLTGIVIILVSMTCLPGCLTPDPPRNPYVIYEVYVDTDLPVELELPLPVLDEVVNHIKLYEGEGTYSFVETVHGQCVRLATDRYLAVRSMWIPKNGSEIESMSINLTTMVQNETIDYHYVGVPPNRTFWMNVPSMALNGVMLIIRMHPSPGPIFEYRFRTNAQDLIPGWNLVNASGTLNQEFID